MAPVKRTDHRARRPGFSLGYRRDARVRSPTAAAAPHSGTGLGEMWQDLPNLPNICGAEHVPVLMRDEFEREAAGAWAQAADRRHDDG